MVWSPRLRQRVQGAGRRGDTPRFWAQGCNAGVHTGAQVGCQDVQAKHSWGSGGWGGGEACRVAGAWMVAAG